MIAQPAHFRYTLTPTHKSTHFAAESSSETSGGAGAFHILGEVGALGLDCQIQASCRWI